MIDLEGRRVLITGGSRGIGLACARIFAGASYPVDLVSIPKWVSSRSRNTLPALLFVIFVPMRR